MTPSESEEARKEPPRNVDALVSLWSAAGAIFLLFVFLSFRRTFLLFAIPAAGLSAAVYGVIGLTRARRIGDGRAAAWVGLIMGIGILASTGVVGLWLWEASRSNWVF